jgi:hypothetical protein
MGTRSLKKRRGYGWAWEFQAGYKGPWLLCNWAEPHKVMLTSENAPADGARKVKVELVPTGQRARKRYGY